MKRLFSLVLTLALLLPQTAFAQFNDVANSPYEGSINWMARNQVVDGYQNGDFAPEACTTRSEYLIMLYRMLEVDYYDAHLDFPNVEMIDFTDVDRGEWYYPVVKRGVLSGAIEGYPDGSFRPHNCINRAEAIKIAVLEFNDGMVPALPESVMPEATDLDQDSWYFEKVEFALATDQIGTMHMEANAYDPAASMSREEVAEMLYRMKTVRDHELEYYSDWYEPFPLEDELFYKACDSSFHSDGKRIAVESVIPYDSDIVVGVNHSQSQEIRDLHRLLDTYVPEGIWEEWIAEYNDSDIPNALSYESAVEPFATQDWNFAVSIVATEGGIAELDFDDSEFYLIGSFEAYEAFENFAGRWLHMLRDGDISCERSGEYMYWTAEEDDFYLAHNDGLFVATNSAENREKAVTRAENPETFDYGNNSSSLYAYVSEDVSAEFMSLVEEEMAYELGGMNMMPMETFGALSLTLDAEWDGVRVEMTAEVDEDGMYAELYEGTAGFYEMMDGENTVLYAEAQNLADALGLNNFAAGMDLYGMMNAFLLTTDEEAEVVEEADFMDLLSSPYAFSVNNRESAALPGVTFALDFTGKEIPQLFQDNLTTLVDELFGYELGGSTEEDGFSLWTIAMDAENSIDLKMGLSGNRFVVSIDPEVHSDFDDSTSLDLNADFQDTLANLSMIGSSLSYWNPEELEAWVAASPWAAELMNEDSRVFWEIFGNFGSGASTAWHEDGVITTELFIGIR